MTSSAPPADGPAKELTVLFADIVGSTAQYPRRGADVAGGMVRESLARVAASVAREGGREVKRIGDASMAVFASPAAAARAAIEIHTLARQAGVLRFRVGFASGPLVE